jgi:hypothetical protein
MLWVTRVCRAMQDDDWSYDQLVDGDDRACSTVVIALCFGTQGPGFEPGLFHKAIYMPLHGCCMKRRVLSIEMR